MSWLLAIKSSAQSLDYRANSYHIHLNYLDLYARGREISPEYHYSNWPINKDLRNARLLPSDSNLWHSSLSSGDPDEQPCNLNHQKPSPSSTSSLQFVPPSSSGQWQSTLTSLRFVLLLLLFTSILFVLASSYSWYFFLFFFVLLILPT
jgi:hypothetical protein